MIINATLATNINIECEYGGDSSDRQHSCGSITIYGNNITINCKHDESCMHANITVSRFDPSGDLVRNCNGLWSCFEMTLTASNYFSSSNPSGNLVLTCNGDNSCEGMTVDAKNFLSRYIYTTFYEYIVSFAYFLYCAYDLNDSAVYKSTVSRNPRVLMQTSIAQQQRSALFTAKKVQLPHVVLCLKMYWKFISLIPTIYMLTPCCPYRVSLETAAFCIIFVGI